MKESVDRIQKGVDLARAGYVHTHASGWTVESQANRLKSYEVTRDGSCTCPDFAKNLTICKHAHASIGYDLALALVSFRDAATIEALDSCFDAAVPLASMLPRGFKLSARHEYARNFARITEEIDRARAAARVSTRKQISANQAGLAARISEAIA